MLPKRYWTRQYPALIAFSESRELGYLRGEDTVDTERLYKSLDFWFEQWRKDKETISGNKPVHPMRYFYEEDYKSRESVTSKKGFLLKTGWIVHGKPRKYVTRSLQWLIINLKLIYRYIFLRIIQESL